jgi:ABC-type transport system involved in cytochrome c biogenesis permease subunit
MRQVHTIGCRFARSGGLVGGLLGFLLLLCPAGTAQDTAFSTDPWESEVLELFASLPLQHGGRIKPLDSVAGLKLLTLNGKRKVKLDEGGKLGPVAWYLDGLFRPDAALRSPCFRVQSDAVLTAVGQQAKGKRAWYSYEELHPARTALFDKASRISGMAAAERSSVERQILKLAGDLRNFEGLANSLEILRREWSPEGSAILAEMIEEDSPAPLTEILRRVELLQVGMATPGPEREAQRPAIEHFLHEIEAAIDRSAAGPAFFPPPADAEDQDEWWTISHLVSAAFSSPLELGAQLDLLEPLERMARAESEAEFLGALRSFRSGVDGLAAARGEGERISLEVRLNGLDPFTRALVFYILGFLLVATSWILPKLRVVRGAAWVSIGLATLLLVLGITMRCVISGRPPVVSLYDTIVFITGCMVIISLVLERLTRQQVGLALSTILGAVGMFVAGRYELKEVASSGDTMASLLAVLDTNYYLTIHVVTIALGYAGGLLAGAIAHVWILGKLFGLRRGDRAFYSSLSRTIYGVLCFSLIFSIIGTITGGVWANDAWGRFWGWDPKENGALLICIWQILILHAMRGGFLRERGLAVMAVLGGVVVSASWWGVNLLNVGLHSYGFTSGIAASLFAFWAVETLIALLAGVELLRHSSAAKGASDSGGVRP